MSVSPPPPGSIDAAAAHDIAEGTARLQAAHRDETSTLQGIVDRMTACVAWPGFAAVVAVAVGVWIGGNLIAMNDRVLPIDPPPFVWLQLALAVGAFVMVALILTTQRREDQLASHRAQMILELSILNDKKISKIIALIEEGRRDNPALVDRVDGQAAAMSTPADTLAVLEAIKEVQMDPI